MKNAVKDESTVSIRVIYDRYLTSLQDQKFEISNIQSMQDGKLPGFQEMSNTLKKVRGSIVPILPKNLDDIDFDQPEYKLYTQTSEFKPFLQYDNKKKGNRVF